MATHKRIEVGQVIADLMKEKCCKLEIVSYHDDVGLGYEAALTVVEGDSLNDIRFESDDIYSSPMRALRDIQAAIMNWRENGHNKLPDQNG